MVEVYGSAVVNIAAMNASDGSMGLFVARDAFKVERQYFQTGKGNVFEIVDNYMSERCLVDTPLPTRAWAFQFPRAIPCPTNPSFYRRVNFCRVSSAYRMRVLAEKVAIS
jgi:hypothetical protein